MRAAALPLMLVPLTLAGCMSLNDLKPADDGSSQYYILDTASRMLCKGTSNRCQDLAPINTANHLLKPIEEAYGQTVEGPNFSVSLMKLVLQPPDNAYPVQAISGKRYHYRLPINEQTRVVWDTLGDIYADIYNTPGK
ncbi:hypothetical protein [Marinobacterium arenosum]|uniref:hypothetical protein n=1 Tax=Marinobacterium arenosum TaxID=2862496 RepID=UPI001C950E18|nr:hypothetical protein [Marinobacterium arenosum]MBY4675633.1 hypothetical protein [Marinobacterium arenosum]